MSAISMKFNQLKAEKAPKNTIHFELELNFSAIFKGLFHALFVGPKLQKQSAPGEFEWQENKIHTQPSMFYGV